LTSSTDLAAPRHGRSQHWRSRIWRPVQKRPRGPPQIRADDPANRPGGLGRQSSRPTAITDGSVRIQPGNLCSRRRQVVGVLRARSSHATGASPAVAMACGHHKLPPLADDAGEALLLAARTQHDQLGSRLSRTSVAGQLVAETPQNGPMTLAGVNGPGLCQTPASPLTIQVAAHCPSWSKAAALEVTPVAGRLATGTGLLSALPFCSPRQTSPKAAIVDGGPGLRPSAACLAHIGTCSWVKFLSSTGTCSTHCGSR